MKSNHPDLAGAPPRGAQLTASVLTQYDSCSSLVPICETYVANQMKIAIAGFILESVSFLLSSATNREEEMVARHRGTETVLGGFIDIYREGTEMVPIVWTSGDATAPAADDAFDEHVGRMNDSTHVTRELIRKGASNAAVPFLWDSKVQPLHARPASQKPFT